MGSSALFYFSASSRSAAVRRKETVVDHSPTLPEPPPTPRPTPYDVATDSPARPEPLPRFARASGGVPEDESLVQPGPVPEDPPHHCPACDYNLTGLYSRRCPECGRPFRLFETRRERWPPTPQMIQDRKVARRDFGRMILGLTMTFAAFLGLVLWEKNTRPVWVWSTVAVPVWILSLGAAFRMNLKYNIAMALAGMITFVLGLLLLLL